MSMDLTSRLEGGVGHLRVIGEVDAMTAPELRAAGSQLLDDNARTLLVDCARLTFIDSAGLSVLIELHDMAEVRYATMTIGHPSDQVRRLLSITGLDRKLILAPSSPVGTS
jgi:anti-sigma B factor antagonist